MLIILGSQLFRSILLAIFFRQTRKIPMYARYHFSVNALIIFIKSCSKLILDTLIGLSFATPAFITLLYVGVKKKII